MSIRSKTDRTTTDPRRFRYKLRCRSLVKRLGTVGMKEPVDAWCALRLLSNVVNLPLELSKALLLLSR